MNRFWITTALAATSLAGGYAVAACTSVTTGAPAVTGAAPAAHLKTSAAARVVAFPAPKPVPPKVRIERTYSDGSLVTVATFSGPVRYALYDGSQDPYIPYREVRDQSAVTGGNRTRLLAAFNGGFKMVADSGGYEQEGHLISPLRYGFASLVINRAGQARIGVWGHGLPDGDVSSVRQNLQALVLDGKPTSASYDWRRWGATLGGGEYVARSAIGQNPAGDIMYAGSMSSTPYDLARALSKYGARTGMELDINPAWVQLDVAHEPGGHLHAEVAGQYRPADQYVDGWTRDFVAVLGP